MIERGGKTGEVKLYLGNCLEVMKMLPDGCVDAVVTDPPYGIGFEYLSHDDDPQRYETMMLSIVEQTNRLNRGLSFFWQAMLNADKWHRWFPPGFRLFAACKGFVQFRPTPIQYSFDPIVFWGNGNGEASVYKKDWHVQALAPFGMGREKIEHPCPRPLEQVAYIVEIASRPGDTILDPFMGSGTTGVACIQTGRNFIGIEIDPTYYAIAEKRIAEAQAQPLLPAFGPAGDLPLPTQDKMDLDDGSR
jgi:site-specific DNA-methyltransferase (adenine-specific)